MAIYADRVKETTTTTGTGTYSLAGAAAGFRTFVAGVGTGAVVTYCAEDGTNWEIGEGTVTDAATDTLTRTSILASSNAGAAVSWAAGSKNIFLTAPATRLAITDSTQTLTNKTIAYASNTLTGVQPTLVSGTSLKTVNGTSLLGSGDIPVDVAAEIVAASAKTTPVDADSFGLVDSAASSALKELTWANVKATMWTALGALVAGGTTKATPVDADKIPLSDSAASNATKYLSWTNLKAAVKTYYDDVTATLTNKTINLTSNTLTGTTAQFNTALSDGDFATLAGSETLTNKTLTTPVISTITNTGTLTLPTSTDTLVGRDTTDTLTNKTLTSPVISTISNGGTITLPSSTQTLVGRTTTDTLTNKTLTSVVFNDGFTEEVYAVVDAAGVAISPTNGSIQTWTLGASRTPTLGTWASGQSLALHVADGTAYAVTWTTMGIVWVGGTAPALPTSGYAVIELWKVGTTIYGAHVGNVA